MFNTVLSSNLVERIKKKFNAKQSLDKPKKPHDLMEVAFNSKAVFLWEDLHQLLLFQIPAVPKAICVTQDGQEDRWKQSIKKN